MRAKVNKQGWQECEIEGCKRLGEFGLCGPHEGCHKRGLIWECSLCNVYHRESELEGNYGDGICRQCIQDYGALSAEELEGWFDDEDRERELGESVGV